MLALYVEAPFAVCRTFTAGWYRPTATFLTPSAAYGLVLNLAGIESRLREEDENHSGKVSATLMRSGLPPVRMALAASAFRREGRHTVEVPDSDRYPQVATVFQQLHNYPVGAAGVDRASTAFGNKYNVAPVRRELLVCLRAIIALDGNADLEASVRRGLSGESSSDRYGLPFLADNAFLPDRIEILDMLPPAHWYERISEEQSTIRPRTTRLTIWIDRADMSRTRSELYAPSVLPKEVSPAAWTDIAPAA